MAPRKGRTGLLHRRLLCYDRFDFLEILRRDYIQMFYESISPKVEILRQSRVEEAVSLLMKSRIPNFGEAGLLESSEELGEIRTTIKLNLVKSMLHGWAYTVSIAQRVRSLFVCIDTIEYENLRGEMRIPFIQESTAQYDQNNLSPGRLSKLTSNFSQEEEENLKINQAIINKIGSQEKVCHNKILSENQLLFGDIIRGRAKQRGKQVIVLYALTDYTEMHNFRVFILLALAFFRAAGWETMLLKTKNPFFYLKIGGIVISSLPSTSGSILYLVRIPLNQLPAVKALTAGNLPDAKL